MSEAMAGMMASQHLALQQELNKAAKDNLKAQKEDTSQAEKNNRQRQVQNMLLEPTDALLQTLASFMDPADAFFTAIGSILGGPLVEGMGKAIVVMEPLLTALEKVASAIEDSKPVQDALKILDGVIKFFSDAIARWLGKSNAYPTTMPQFSAASAAQEYGHGGRPL
jgi:hypothetical protein